jgi:hypothetical protein
MGAAGTGFDPLFIVAIAAGIGLLAAFLLIGSQLANSTSATKEHLANASALTPAANESTRDLPRPLGIIAPNDLFSGGHSRAPVAAAPADDATSRQTFTLLNSYYLANISQGTTIFWASLLAMTLGFAIIVIGVVLAGVHSTTAIVAAIAGVLSQFIGATFLIVLRSTQTQATSYAQNLVDLRLHDMRASAQAQSVALGLQLVGDIAADGADVLANQTRAAIAMGLIVGSGPPASTAPAPGLPLEPDASRPAPDAHVRTRVESITFDETPRTSEQRVPEPGKP